MTDLLERPEVQQKIMYAVRTLDAIALLADDDRAEIPFTRKTGKRMLITIEEDTTDRHYEEGVE